ncbi:MAG: DUF481 domain-containing protein [Proteobacteria bacterium]|nr:DUF481 domain-containing protein [Pseudomonadota bacterium]MCP4918677.1 DUF481 domain-containing protein [Pseudomonadota bacterium]
MGAPLLLLVGLAQADDTVFVEPASPPEEPVEHAEKDLAAELGGAWSAGNTDSRTLTASLDGAVRWNRNQVSTHGALTVGSTRLDADGDGVLSPDEREEKRVQTARQGDAKLRYDRFLSDRNSLYVLGGAFTDPYAGYDARYNGQTGYSHLLMYAEDAEEEPVTSLSAEVGFDAAAEDYAEGVVPNRGMKYSARGSVAYVRALSKSVDVGSDVEVFVNVIDPKDTRLISDTALTNALTETMSLKLTYKLTYDTDPVAGYVPADHTGLVSIVATVL